MKPRKTAINVLKLGWLTLLPLMASAMDKNSTATVSVAGGIAMPSYSTATYQNGAGLAYNPGTNFQIQGGSTDSNFENQIFRAGLAYGNGTIGIAAGGSYGNPSGNSGAYYGLAFGIQSLRTVIGFSGSMGLSPSSDPGVNAGMLIYPSQAFNFGFTAMGLTNSGGIQEIGAGIGLHLGPGVSLVVDTAFGSDFSFRTIQPGLKVGNTNASLTVSYGSGDGSQQLSNNEFAAGASIKIGNKINWELYYNRFATYYTGFSFPI
jgi:hypothetical protein